VSIDFARVAAALLPRAAELCREWFPDGRQSGHEFLIGNLRGDKGESLSVNLTTGKWADFSGEERGGDLVSLYAAIHKIDQVAAARALRPDLCNDSAGERPVIQSGEDLAPDLPPATAGLPRAHAVHGEAVATYRYVDADGRLLFLVCRYEPSGERKQFVPYTWRNGRWTAKSWPKPRPLYRLDQLARRPDARVLIVEGEKCADLAATILTDYIVLTWPNGAKSVDKCDWTSLAGRAIDIWPDADDQGRQAAATLARILRAKSDDVRIVDPKDQSDGWDIVDAVVDGGWNAAQILKWIDEHLVSPALATVTPISGARKKNEAPPTAQYAESAVMSWQAMGLKCNSGGIPWPMEGNVVAILAAHPRTSGKIWYDTFREEVYHSMRGTEEAWTDNDSRDLLLWMQTDLQLVKFKKTMVDEGVLMYATRADNKRNSVTQWLESEVWDKEPRLDTWLWRYLGCPNDVHHRQAGRNWLIAMVARAYDPGCQADNMLVLEGKEGRGKSSALQILASPWSVTLTQRFGSKEFTEALQGNWLIELADLSSFSATQHLHILADITKRHDRYRTPWDRLASTHARRCIFAATTEKHSNYLADTYGIRRFWALKCTTIHLDALKIIRGQLFAEALIYYRAGEPWHVMPAETHEVQIERVEQDLYLERIRDYLLGRTETRVLDIFEAVFVAKDTFGRPIGRSVADDKDNKRITRTLRQLGWYPIAVKRDKVKINLWKPLTSSGLEQPEPENEPEPKT